MSFEQIHQILGAIEPHYHSLERQQLEQILACWTQIVGDRIAQQTRPIALQRQILEVATASPVWTQTLVFQRPTILKKLNDRLLVSIADLRFSTAHWQPSASDTVLDRDLDLWQNHPSRLPEQTQSEQLVLLTDAATAFDRWAATVQKRGQQLPLCSRCNSPTPLGELQRWSVCSICAASTKQ